MKPKSSIRYFLSQDQSSHWYLVEADKRAQWDKWNEIPEDDPKAWETPTFAHALGGSPNLVEFELPLMNGKPI